MSIRENLDHIRSTLPEHVTLVAVSKTHPAEAILEAYNAEQRVFGENKVQELVSKYEQLPKDIEWHLIGHLQSNKVKFVAQFVSLIHSVDSLSLLKEINKQAGKSKRVINCLLQLHIAEEETKFGLSYEECEALLVSEELSLMRNIKITGMMGMATNTDNKDQIKKEFRSLRIFFEKLKVGSTFNFQLSTLSMGMSSDYRIAIEEGSTMIRVGSTIFGNREYKDTSFSTH
ncbi:MAG: YggS family pyridoxal phosphate-dependent enzyme [Bacteroidia bacterium]